MAASKKTSPGVYIHIYWHGYMDYSSKLLTDVLCGPNKYSLHEWHNLLNYFTLTLRKEQILPTFMYVLGFTSLTTPGIKYDFHKIKA